MRVALLLFLVLGCSSVQTPSSGSSPGAEVGRRAVIAAMRIALIEACRATIPPIDAHAAHKLAWALACSTHTEPAAGVSLPLPPPLAPPSEVH